MLGKYGRLKGKIRIKDGDESTFIAERGGGARRTDPGAAELPRQVAPDPRRGA